MSIPKTIIKRTKKSRSGEVTGHVWRARYSDDAGQIHTKHFPRKEDAKRWLDTQTAGLVTGTHIAPGDATTTMAAWTARWLAGYAGRPTSLRQAKTHIVRINAEFGQMRLGDIRPSHVNAWTRKMQDEGLAQSTIHALYRRMVSIMNAAVEDRLTPRTPCGRSTSVKPGEQRMHVPTTEQIWTLYDAFPEHLRAAVLLAAFCGLRVGEVCGLRVADVDFLRREVRPQVQYPTEPLKTKASKWPVPISESLAELLSVHVRDWSGDTVLLDPWQHSPIGPWTVERAFRKHRPTDEMHFHDLRHYFASLLISGGADVKVIQQRLRHENATTTLNTYAHMWPDADERSRATVEAVFVARRLAG